MYFRTRSYAVIPGVLCRVVSVYFSVLHLLRSGLLYSAMHKSVRPEVTSFNPLVELIVVYNAVVY